MQKKMLYAVVAIVLVVVVVGAAVAVILMAPLGPRVAQVELWYNSDGHYGDTEAAVAQVLKDSIEASGKIQVTLRSEPWATYTQDFSDGNLPLFLLGWYPDYFDSDNYVSPFLTTDGAASLGSFYNDSQMNTWISQQAATTNDATRASLFQQIQNKLADDVPYIPLWQAGAHVVYDNDISNVNLHPITFKWFIMDKPGATAITAGTTDRVTSFDPASAYDYFSIEVINNVFDTLLVYEPVTTDLMPGLAIEVPTVANGGISADGMTYTYNLRSGVTFHDGTDFNATVMKWSIERVLELNIAGSPRFLLDTVGKIESIATPDDSTVVFTLSEPVSFFNQLMAFSVSAPVSMAAYNNNTEQPNAVGQIIGTGPYELSGYVAGARVVLSRNTAYYNPGIYASFGIPTIPVEDTVTIELLATATNLKAAVEADTINVAYRTLNPEDVTDLNSRESALGITVDLGTSPQIRYLVFNVETYSDVRLRRAIAYLVDRAAIDTLVFSGLSEPLYSMVPGAMPYSQPVFQTEFGASPNVAAANDLLSQMGFSVFIENLVARDWF